ncbi:phasin family protein [Tardiphaga sp.]|uniref:phasin family protein n=1 Tax=Tardiphaga sp. TaxID=1926292 RepID=UPI00352A5010
MIDPKIMPMTVPVHIRDFAERSVEMAKKAVSTFIQSAASSIDMVPRGPMSDVAREALAITEKNVSASFEHAHRLLQAKDIGEAMQLQSDFVRSQFSATTQHLKEYQGRISGAVDEVVKGGQDQS